MYREQGKAPRPPTIVEYISKQPRIRVFLFSAISLVAAFLSLAMIHATHLECSREICKVDAYGLLVRDRHQEIPVAEIREFHVRITTSGKGGRSALVAFRMRNGSLVDLTGRAMSDRFDPGSATVVQQNWNQWHSSTTPTFDAWIAQSTLVHAIELCIAAALLGLAYWISRDEIRQRFKIHLAVDHTRGVLQIGGREVRTDEIEWIDLSYGEALTWSTGKNQTIIGARVIAKTKSGLELVATPDFRAGPMLDHEKAAKALRAATGKPGRPSEGDDEDDDGEEDNG